ncbi:alanyl-tRNA synthetase [Saprolegnia diclina VS20]|uniref:Alanine--tRNA ligase n=1 Tax=Saprolegnia diclina (strain VS20) TaxID=1156394 RepID=T0PY03_SAPDV|nr:alanyl-tRNA synthetase [Saprolegnia diclina VS20]EQC27131.1 alanyl-tRNA synthetase [Saprolegnia diclina VS20]|eukprot:XP_008619417.1 alanyl-tRNA synthetase [Saprolegnia diclina VS20]
MTQMHKAAAIRRNFLRYFQQHEHALVPSSSLVPSADPSLLFTNAGMVQFKQVFLGNETRPYARATSAQRCVRAGGKHNDLDQVGLTARHHTCFEMLGNFSFGDYFKEEAIFHAWQFLTKELSLPVEKLHVTVLDSDDEAVQWWRQIAQLPDAKIHRLGAEDNFWAMGETGPCGPCTEIFYDQGDAFTSADDRYLELWNLVFMQHDRAADGTLSALPRPCVDTGMGLERMASVMQGVISNYHTDLFTPLLHTIASSLDAQLGVTRYTPAIAAEIASNTFGTDRNVQSVRIVADHLRTTYALLADGVFPSNVGRGYVLRRILRRAIRVAGASQPFLSTIQLPSLLEMDVASRLQLTGIVENEEKAFFAMQSTGTRAIEKLLHATRAKHITGPEAYKLYDTFGLTIDMTESIALALGATVDVDGFQIAMATAQANAADGPLSASAPLLGVTPRASSTATTTEFVGYDQLRVPRSKVVQFERSASNGLLLQLSPSPFYAEGGGQVGDIGFVGLDHFGEDIELPVIGTTKVGEHGSVVHVAIPEHLDVEIVELLLKKSPAVHAVVDARHRQRTAVHHSATHVLQAGLRHVLGPHVAQAGSYVGSDRLRFDFAHFGGMTNDQLKAVEAYVNDVALSDASIRTEEMDKDAAQATGAICAFGEKYGDRVRVVRIGDVSSEFCGGTHAASAASLYPFVVLSEASVAAGTRRIEAVAGIEGVKRLQEKEAQLEQLAMQLSTSPAMASQKLTRLDTQLKALESFSRSVTDHVVSSSIAPIATGVYEATPVALHRLDLDCKDASNSALRTMYMQALRRRAEFVAKADVTSAHIVLLGDSIICMGNNHVHAGEMLKKIVHGLGSGGGNAACGQGKLLPSTNVEAVVRAVSGATL